MNSLYDVGREQYKRGDLSGALKNAEYGFRRSSHDPIWNWKFRELEAEILVFQSRPEKALELLDTPPPPELAKGVFAVWGKNTQGNALGILLRPAEARERLKAAEVLALATAPELQCETLLREGDLALTEGQFSLAEEKYRKSLELTQRYHDSFTESAALNGIGLAAMHLGRYDEAIELFSSALAHSSQYQYRLNQNIALANLAWSFLQLGDPEKAISYLSEELKVVNSLGQDQLEEAVFELLGEAYAAEENYSAAREAYLKALGIARRALIDNNKDYYYVVEALSKVASLALDQGNVDEAEKYSRQASELRPNNHDAMLVQCRVQAARHNLTEAIPLLQKLADSKKPDKFIRWDAQSELANISAGQNHRDLAERQFQELIDAVEYDRSHLRTDENRLAFSSHARRFYDDYVRFLVTSGQKKKAFQVAEFSRARTLAEGVGLKAPASPSDIRIEEIQRFLKQNGKTVLAYWLGRDQSCLWLVSPTRFELVPLATGREIERQTEDYRHVLLDLNDSQALDQKGQALYATLVAPVEKLLSPAARLVIVPHGGLTKINFETLRVPHPKPHFWIEDVELETASSTSLLIHGKARRFLAPRKFLAIGDPVETSADYPRLLHALEELRRVEAHFSPDQESVFSEKSATPSAYLSNHPENFGFIHFVTHGTASELSPLESAIILSPDAGNSFKLYARDIVNIPLNADIVTISACYGAGKRAYSGEGLVGLAWAFLRAGAHQVVAGLWEVDDRASVDLMDDFYTELPKVKSAATALRLAKLKMVKLDNTYSHPYYWASLQLYTGR